MCFIDWLVDLYLGRNYFPSVNALLRIQNSEEEPASRNVYLAYRLLE